MFNGVVHMKSLKFKIIKFVKHLNLIKHLNLVLNTLITFEYKNASQTACKFANTLSYHQTNHCK